MKSLHDLSRSRLHRLWICCSALFVLVFVGGYFATRGVINQPWTARTNMGSAVIGDQIFVVGGQSQFTGELLDDVLRLDPNHASLRFVAQLPYACHRPGIAVSNDSLFVLGGYDGKSYRSEILRVVDDEARVIARLPGPRAYGAAIGVGNALYYAGGWDGERMLDDIVAIDLSSGAATVVAQLSSPRRFVAAAAVGNLIYFVGGEGSRSTFSDEIVEFDPERSRIVRIGHLPTGRYLVGAVSGGSNLLVLGGKNTRSLDEVLSVDVSGATLDTEVVGRITELSWNLAVEAIEDRVFIIGGSDSTFRKAIGLLEYVWDSDAVVSHTLRKSP
ncbi:Kelch repeat-containing protein, partial [Candidatus Bipolaricaulota bacterium]